MARDVRAGRAFIEMFLKGDKIERQLRTMRRRLKRFGDTVGSVAKQFTLIGVAAGGTVAAGILKATKAAGDLAEAASKFETVFGDRANVVQEWALETGAALGVTRREMLDTLSGFQDLFVPIGIAAGEAEKMSQSLTQLAIDLASFNNMRTADVVRDLQAAMTGSSETMKKYGVIVDAAAVDQQLLNMGLTGTITNADKLNARLQIIMASTTAAQGDAERTADSYSNMVKKLRTDFEELMADIGQEFLPIMNDLASAGVRAIEDIRNAVGQFDIELDGVTQAVLDLAKSGQWEQAGELIGLQLKSGLRKAIGPGLVDFFLDANQFLKDIGVPTSLSQSMQASRANLMRAAEAMSQMEGEGPQRVGNAFLGTGRTTEVDRRIQELINLSRQQLEQETRAADAIENAEGAVFQ